MIASYGVEVLLVGFLTSSRLLFVPNDPNDRNIAPGDKLVIVEIAGYSVELPPVGILTCSRYLFTPNDPNVRNITDMSTTRVLSVNSAFNASLLVVIEVIEVREVRNLREWRKLVITT